MKYLIFFFVSLGCLSAYAQELTLSEAPEFYQLYGRNERDSASVVITGKVLDKEYRGNIVLKVFKDGQEYDQQSSAVENQTFNLSSKIHAGLHQFKFDLYLEENGAEKLAYSADSVVCGDAYIITGQSNSHASSSKATYSSPYARSFGVKTGYAAYTDDHKKVRWGKATGNSPGLDGVGDWFKEIDHGVGVWGITLMQELLDKYEVPICIINGGSGASSIQENMLYPEKSSLETSFGRLAYRVNEAGLKNNIKAILWHQGESNTNPFYNNYQEQFDELSEDWDRVYENIEKVYLFQLHPGCGADNQSELREVQRQIAAQNEYIEIMSTTGLPGHDGCHYTHEGYVAMAKRIAPLLGRDFYGDIPDSKITPPKVLSAYYSSEREITLEFDQNLSWENSKEIDGVMHYLKDQFYFRGARNGDILDVNVESGKTEGNRVILTVDDPILNFITYLPNKNYPGTTDNYNGPWLSGENRIGALSFDRVGIIRTKPRVVYSQKPAHMQLYPRNKDNTAVVAISGTIYTKGYQKAVCKVYRDHKLVETIENDLIYNSGTSDFGFAPKIEAGLWSYRFETAFYREGEWITDSSFDNIVSGDVYLINGQSNSHPSRMEAIYKNEFCRSFGLNTNYSEYNPADTLWGLASGNNSQENHVSAWGIQLMKRMVENHKVPVAMINGGSGGSSIEYNLPNEEDLLSLKTTYGRLLYRARKAGVENNIKAMIWHQGESNSNENSYMDYDGNFRTLYNVWKRDYPTIEKIYVFQIHPGCGGDKQSELREIQRKFGLTYSDVTTISTSGLVGHDGCHYTNEGYVQMGEWLYPYIASDFYGVDMNGAGSPDILRAYYSKPGKEITLQFSKEVIWPSERYESYEMEDYIYLDGQNHLIEKGRHEGDRIILTLDKKTKARSVSYLPGHFYENTTKSYLGPWIFGTNGYGALSFDGIVIENK